jgi:hypothetical protein
MVMRDSQRYLTGALAGKTGRALEENNDGPRDQVLWGTVVGDFRITSNRVFFKGNRDIK